MFNIKQVQQWALKSYQRLIALCVEANPTAVYHIIATSFPGQFDMLQPGYEKQLFIKNKMIAFLADKAKQHNNPAAFVTALLQTVQLPETDEAQQAITNLINSNRF